MHDLVCTSQVSHDAKSMRTIFFELNKGRLAQKISSEKHPVSDFVFLQVSREIGVRKRSACFYPDHESEPGAIGSAAGVVPHKTAGGPFTRVTWQGEIEKLRKTCQPFAKVLPVSLSGLYESRQLL